MSIEVRISRLNLNPNNPVKAYASVTLENGYAVHGLKVCSGQNGLFVSMPSTSYVDQNGVKKYRDVFHPVKKESREELISSVMNEYKAALQNAMEFGQRMDNSPGQEQSDEPELEEPEPVMAEMYM